MRSPRSTYRLQLNADFTLVNAAAVMTYLADLGIDWVYLSPLLQSTTGSDHGYDVTDHARTDAARGGRAGLAACAAAAHRLGMGVLVDIVPNHVGISAAEQSLWWWDVLRRGRYSVHAHAFDIDWDAGGGRVLLPVLGDGADELEELRLEHGELRYYEHRFPIADGTTDDDPRVVHQRQHYELVQWRRADTDLNYRRFFAVSTLAGVRVELPDVFADSHAEIAQWIAEGWVDGLRVDHPDGLAAPKRYLDDLSVLSGGRYTVVEKILEPGERLPAGWACAGTTGYDALADIDRVLVDPAGAPLLTDLDTELRGAAMDWPAQLRACKHLVATGILRAEVRRLARMTPDVTRADEAFTELLCAFSVYRSYLPTGADELAAAADAAKAARPDLDRQISILAYRLANPASDVAVRFQQTTGSVMAKGVEDTAFYRWPRLSSLTEVGGDPAQFAVDPTEFHRRQAARLQEYPHGMTTLSTHDTKRGEDVRARIAAIAEIPDDWAQAVRRWNMVVPLADPPLAHLVWQAAVGAWPIERDRLAGFALKAARESATRTTWAAPDAGFEEALRHLVDAVYDLPELAAAVGAMAWRLRAPGWSNSLSAKLLQVAGPGVPDVYQGTELWRNCLVDPDNRLPVDHTIAATLLARLDAGYRPPVDASGAAKLLVTSRTLRLRRSSPEKFAEYRPVTASGVAADHLIAADRGGTIMLATRLPIGLEAAGGWRDTAIQIPTGAWRDAFTGNGFAPGTTDVSALLSDYPVALLVRREGAGGG